jgi:hypothetical protein
LSHPKNIIVPVVQLLFIRTVEHGV